MSDPLTIPSLLILTQREHSRLNTQIKRLQGYELDAYDLIEYKENWQQRLGFHRHISLLIQSVDNLIDALEQGDYDESLYEEVILQLGLYKKTCWAVMERVYGSLGEYLDQRKQVKTKYKQQFARRYEGFEKLSIDDQVEVMRTILSSIDVSHYFSPPDKSVELLQMIGVFSDDLPADGGGSPPEVIQKNDKRRQDTLARMAKGSKKVIDLIAYRQSR